VSTTAITLQNPGFRGFASFSSGGPRNGDSALKADISAPGVSTLSTASGTGNKGYVLSGTSMA
jgi:minor extracellular serine protease Vpr